MLAGDRRALARAITLIESTRDDHQERARALLEALLPKTGKSVRIGVSGAPGVGKSTFIEALGLHLIDRGRRVAVLAVDPSSRRRGGALLADKTRMAELRIDFDVREAVLGHAKPDLVARYDKHDYLDEKRAALEMYAAHVVEVVGD